MARWNLAVAQSNYGSDSALKATVFWVRHEGMASGLKGYADLDAALTDLMNDGWEPFSAHRWDDPTTTHEPYRDYIWLRREVMGKAPATRGGPQTAEATPPKSRR